LIGIWRILENQANVIWAYKKYESVFAFDDMEVGMEERVLLGLSHSQKELGVHKRGSSV
jgi:hypothetical protein